MNSVKNNGNRDKGFTIVELIIAIGISGIVLAAIFSIYKLQQQHYTAQLDVTEMQQNIRGALNLITSDIRMAGFDQEGSGAAEIINAEADLFYYTVDFNEDGDTDDTGEHIAYDLYMSNGKPTLGRTTANTKIIVTDQGGGHWEVDPVTPTDPTHQPAAENIEHLEFHYLDKDGAVPDKTVPSWVNTIRTVVISIVARADQPDIRYTNNQTYTFASGTTWTAPNDNYRRRLQIMTIQCRNIGI